MTKVLLLSGSARPNSAGKNVVETTKKLLEARPLEVESVDVKTLNLPFFDGEVSPADPGFNPANEAVKAWTAKVGAADAVVLVTPEYNGSLTAIQKNAIDWIKKEWVDKPVGLIGYGWYGGRRAHDNARVVLGNVEAQVLPETAHLTFQKELDPSGNIIDEAKLKSRINTVIDAIVKFTK